jgi:hypothetical protein
LTLQNLEEASPGLLKHEVNNHGTVDFIALHHFHMFSQGQSSLNDCQGGGRDLLERGICLIASLMAFGFDQHNLSTCNHCKCLRETNRWVKKMHYIYTMVFHSAIMKSEIMSFAGKWMELKIITLSEIWQSHRGKCHVFSQWSLQVRGGINTIGK